jgi:hypothetical protein
VHYRRRPPDLQRTEDGKPQADSFAAGLVVMAMLGPPPFLAHRLQDPNRSWLMAQRDEITSMSRDTVLGALTELMFRMLAEGVVVWPACPRNADSCVDRMRVPSEPEPGGAGHCLAATAGITRNEALAASSGGKSRVL